MFQRHSQSNQHRVPQVLRKSHCANSRCYLRERLMDEIDWIA